MHRSVAALVPLLAASLCVAQPPAGGPAPTPQGRPIDPDSPNEWRFRLDLSGRWDFRSDFRNNTGDVQVGRAGFEFSAGYVPDSKWRFGLDLGLEESWYQFRNSTLVPGTGDPLGDATRLQLAPTIGYQIDERWGVLVGGLLNFSFENGADIGQSFTGGAIVGARYKFNENFTLTFGVIASSRLEDDWVVYPLLGLRWQITPEVTLESRGLGLELTAKIADAWSVVVFGLYESREFRLDDSGPLPDGVARDQRIPIGVGVVFRPTKDIDVRLEGGFLAWQRFTFDDSTGARIGRQEADLAPMIGLRGTIRF